MSERVPRVLVVQHQDSCPPAMFGSWLTDAGVALDIRRADLGAEIPSLRSYAGLLVLGGEMDADADTDNPWLPVVRQRILEAARAGVPTLGICLGHQLAGLALGGSVERNPHGRTVGLRQVDWEPTVIFDPLLGTIAGEDRAVQWNQDIVTELPPGAVVLATGLDGSVQAARFAATVWGVQFHPEVDAVLAQRWADKSPGTLEALGLSGQEVVEEVALALPELVKTWQPLAASYAAVVRGRSAAGEYFGGLGR
ncbi:type 1 glutamine amidotransferase [Nocardioides sp. KR10-350]|uniref:type 1 glutamine amidotransferase n=1 Tax=Nocardioides cheoyonin TaxID=3156615 RepID=UPI0032B5D939